MALIDTILAAWRRRYWRGSPERVQAFSSLKPFTVITGASEGIGRAFAVRCAARGDNVLLVARNAARLEALAQELRVAAPGMVAVLPLDATRVDAADIIAARMQNEGGFVDLLINSAGFGLGGAFHSQPADQIDALIALNIATPTRLMRAFLPDMCARGAGGIINMSSLASYSPGPWQAAYCASKAYVTSVSEAVSYETRGQGVRILAVTPGPVETGFHETMGSNAALYRLLIPAMSADGVVMSALSAYRWGRRCVAPGFITPLLMLSVRALPHMLALPLLGVLLGAPPVLPDKK